MSSCRDGDESEINESYSRISDHELYCFEENWVVCSITCCTTFQLGESRETQEDRTRTASVKDGKNGLHSLCAGPGKTKWILYTSKWGMNTNFICSRCSDLEGSLPCFRCSRVSCRYPPAVQHLTVSTGGGSHGQSMKLWGKNCWCAHHLYTVEPVS